jgi:hypothetical protein
MSPLPATISYLSNCTVGNDDEYEPALSRSSWDII